MSLVLNVEILGEFKKLTSATQGAQSSLQGLQDRVGNIATNISRFVGALGITLGFTALIRGVQDSVAAASDLEQQFGALDAIFKDNSDEMKVFSKEMNKIGLSSAQAAKESAYLGSMLKGSGLSLEDTTGKTKDLVRLAGDLAATYGGPTSDAVRAIGSLMRGERDPIERYGVSLKQVDINAQMLTDAKNGLVFASEKEAAMNATLTLLYQKTGDAQGQAAREADSFASKTAELQARMTDAQATIADSLLPALVLVSEWFIDILPEVQKFGDGLVLALDDPEVKKAITNMQTALGNLGLTIGTLFGSTETDEAKGFLNFWIMLAGAIQVIANLLSALGAPIAAAFGNTKPMENWLDTMFDAILGLIPGYTTNKAISNLQFEPLTTPPNGFVSDKTAQVIINTYNSNITAQEIYDKIRRLNKSSGTQGGNFFQ
jgi:hypothetical protein